MASLACVLAACAGLDSQEQQTSAPENNTEKEYLDAVPDELDYGGEDVVILSRALAGWT